MHDGHYLLHYTSVFSKAASVHPALLCLRLDSHKTCSPASEHSVQYSACMHAPQGLIKLVQSLHIPLHLAMKHISCSQCASALRFTIVDPAADALAGGKGTQGRLAEHNFSGDTDIFP